MRFIRYLILAMVCSMLMVSSPLLAKEEEEAEVPLTISYIKLEPSFITNVQQGAKYIRCDIQLMTKNEVNVADIKLHIPAIRHELLMLFGDQKGKNLKSKNGQEKLRKVALKSVQKVMDRVARKDLVDDLFFTYYIVQ